MFQLKDPCPVSKLQLKRTGENCYFCKGCNESVIDFTQSSDEEILAYKGQKVCGIFREDQLATIPVFHWRKAIFFRLLTFASFIGFTVSPVYADEQIPNTENRVEISAGSERKKLFKPRKKRRKKNQSKKKLTRPHYL